MSAPLAGKFQDHYSILGVDPKANSDAIQAAYQRAAEKYHPSNPETGDQDKFDSVNLAFETLCDPGLRAEFDKIKGLDQDEGGPGFSGLAFFKGLGQQSALRTAVLSVLYERRQKHPSKPSLSMRRLDSVLTVANDELTFALWYLKQKSLVASDDKSNLQITVEGMDYLEARRPAPEIVMPFIKPAGEAETPAAPPQPQPAPASHDESSTPSPKTAEQPAENESVLKVLSRALARR